MSQNFPPSSYRNQFKHINESIELQINRNVEWNIHASNAEHGYTRNDDSVSEAFFAQVRGDLQAIKHRIQALQLVWEDRKKFRKAEDEYIAMANAHLLEELHVRANLLKTMGQLDID